MPITIPDRLHELASEIDCDLRDFEKPGEPVDFDEVFGFLRHWAGNAKDEALSEIEDQFTLFDTNLEEVEAEISAALEESNPEETT